jgi:hypothetical protein
VQGLEASLVVRVPSAAMPAEGAELCIRVDAEQVLMFPKQGGAA